MRRWGWRSSGAFKVRVTRFGRGNGPGVNWLATLYPLPPVTAWQLEARRQPRQRSLNASHRAQRSPQAYTSLLATMPPKKPTGQVVQAEVALHQSLKNCLVNLPASLVSVLVNANAVCDAFYSSDLC